MTYETTPKQEQAIRDWLQEAIVPLIEQVLVKKLGQATRLVIRFQKRNTPKGGVSLLHLITMT